MKPRVKYRVIYRNREWFPVKEMYRFFEVSRSGYDAFVKRMGRTDRDEVLVALIMERREQRYGRSLGCQRMQRWLELEKGLRYKFKTVWRVMRKYSLLSETR